MSARGDPDRRDLVAFAGGSGITPIMSLVRTALADSSRRIRLFYANRARDSVIFSDALARLADEPTPTGWSSSTTIDDDGGVVTPAARRVLHRGRGRRRLLHLWARAVHGRRSRTLCRRPVCPRCGCTSSASRWPTPLRPSPPTTRKPPEQTEEVVIELDRKMTTAAYRKGDTLLQTARMAGLRAPSSCETGSCGTCMARSRRRQRAHAEQRRAR